MISQSILHRSRQARLFFCLLTLLLAISGAKKTDTIGCSCHYASDNFAANDRLTLNMAALNGTGLLFAPFDSVKKELQDGKLQQILLNEQFYCGAVYLVFPKYHQHSMKVQSFVEFLGKNFGKTR